NYYNLYEVEAAASIGSWHAEAEFMAAQVDEIGGPTPMFSGGSVQSGYILTGEHRPYNRDNGVPGRILPNCPFEGTHGRGAWEIAGRWSYIDLDDKNIAGGRLVDLTAGLNWYLNKFTKFQFNYVHPFLNSPINGRSGADLVALRAQ